jgi:hypothetical protein
MFMVPFAPVTSYNISKPIKSSSKQQGAARKPEPDLLKIVGDSSISGSVFLLEAAKKDYWRQIEHL